MKYTTEMFIEKANIKHNNFYDYSKSIYINAKTNLNIYCPLHGIFSQNPSVHLAGKGCAKCGFERRKDVNRSTTKEFIEKATKIHGNRFNYNHVEYISSQIKVKIECPIHGIFEQKPNAHLSGDKCKQCCLEDVTNNFSTSGFIKASKGNPCLFYILECWNDNEQFYKIGITTRSVKERYDCHNALPYNYKIVTEITDTAETIWNLEVKLKRNIQSKYIPALVFDGCRKECFKDFNEIIDHLNQAYPSDKHTHCLVA